ncbi:MAG: S8 family serine peptidase, partial [Bacillota bacterium]
MRRWMRRAAALLAALALLSACTATVGPEKPPVVDRDGNKIFDDLDALLREVGPDEPVEVLVMTGGQAESRRLQAEDEIEVRFRYDVVPALAATMTREQVLAYARRPEVVHIEHDAEVRVQMATASHWFGAAKARQDFAVTGDGDGSPGGYSPQDVVVAVIDTGIDAGHVDLSGGKVIAWQDFVNGRTDPYDDNGHGTHVAGIVAGTGTGAGAYRGVAPGAALIGLKVLDGNGSGSLSNVTAAVDWAVANKAAYNIRVISMSLGTSGSSDGTDTLSQAVNRAAEEGIVPVIAAGNAGPRFYTIGSPGAAANAVT